VLILCYETVFGFDVHVSSSEVSESKDGDNLECFQADINNLCALHLSSAYLQ
jgi:hypothetical protein